MSARRLFSFLAISSLLTACNLTVQAPATQSGRGGGNTTGTPGNSQLIPEGVNPALLNARQGAVALSNDLKSLSVNGNVNAGQIEKVLSGKAAGKVSLDQVIDLLEKCLALAADKIPAADVAKIQDAIDQLKDLKANPGAAMGNNAGGNKALLDLAKQVGQGGVGIGGVPGLAGAADLNAALDLVMECLDKVQDILALCQDIIDACLDLVN